MLTATRVSAAASEPQPSCHTLTLLPQYTPPSTSSLSSPRVPSCTA